MTVWIALTSIVAVVLVLSCLGWWCHLTACEECLDLVRQPDDIDCTPPSLKRESTGAGSVRALADLTRSLL